REIVERALPADDSARWLEARDVEAVLRAAGIQIAASQIVSPGEAATAARRMGYPLVAKAVAPGLLHKSDVGGVVLGLESSEAVASAVESMRGRLQAAGVMLEAVQLQREVRGGIEALVGVVGDPTFG